MARRPRLPAVPATWIDRIRLLLATAGGAGLSPWAPGTAGSVVAMLLIALFPGDERYPLAAGFAALAASGACIALGPWAERFFGRKDPEAFVLDEVAGMLLACLAPVRPPLHWCVVAFVLFRVFDVRKPFGIARLQRLRSGWGILVDDLAAGLAALVVTTIARLGSALLAA